MKTNHTQGEWEFVHTEQHPTEENEWHSVVQFKNSIAISITNTKSISKEESEANAKLIASAPEMLKIIKDFIDHTEWSDSFLVEDVEDGNENVYSEAKKLLSTLSQ